MSISSSLRSSSDAESRLGHSSKSCLGEQRTLAHWISKRCKNQQRIESQDTWAINTPCCGTVPVVGQRAFPKNQTSDLGLLWSHSQCYGITLKCLRSSAKIEICHGLPLQARTKPHPNRGITCALAALRLPPQEIPRTFLRQAHKHLAFSRCSSRTI